VSFFKANAVLSLLFPNMCRNFFSSFNFSSLPCQLEACDFFFPKAWNPPHPHTWRSLPFFPSSINRSSPPSSPAKLRGRPFLTPLPHLLALVTEELLSPPLMMPTPPSEEEAPLLFFFFFHVFSRLIRVFRCFFFLLNKDDVYSCSRRTLRFSLNSLRWGFLRVEGGGILEENITAFPFPSESFPRGQIHGLSSFFP